MGWNMLTWDWSSLGLEEGACFCQLFNHIWFRGFILFAYGHRFSPSSYATNALTNQYFVFIFLNTLTAECLKGEILCSQSRESADVAGLFCVQSNRTKKKNLKNIIAVHMKKQHKKMIVVGNLPFWDNTGQDISTRL